MHRTIAAAAMAMVAACASMHVFADGDLWGCKVVVTSQYTNVTWVVGVDAGTSNAPAYNPDEERTNAPVRACWVQTARTTNTLVDSEGLVRLPLLLETSTNLADGTWTNQVFDVWIEPDADARFFRNGDVRHD